MKNEYTIIRVALLIYLAIVLVFILARITGIVNWSWWLVLIPFYAPVIIIAITLTLFIIFTPRDI